MYFFIVVSERAYWFNRLIGARRFLALSEFIFSKQTLDNRGLKWRLVFEAVRLRHRSASEPSVPRIDATKKGRLFFACALQA